MTEAEFESVFQEWKHEWGRAMRGERRFPSLTKMIAARVAEKLAAKLFQDGVGEADEYKVGGTTDE
jgi:hypothetical protein